MLPYGIVGNCNTAALIKEDASVDWFCHPTFSSPSVFGRILDEKIGGSMRVLPVGKYERKQEYIENTAILKTTFTSKHGSFEVIDFFPRYRKLLRKKHEKLYKQNRLVRIIKRISGKPIVKIIYDPKPNYAKETCSLEHREGQLYSCSEDQEISLITNIPDQVLTHKQVYELKHTVYMVVGTPTDASHFTVKHVTSLLSATKQYWQKWVGTLVTPKKGRELIIRSAITLKLLCYSKTGAILAGASCSIPEELHTVRAFDYRFCWLRDAALTVDALKRIGRDYEPKKFMDFIIKVLPKKHLQIMYGINGETDLTEVHLDHLAGFKKAAPVKIGNPAHSQQQNDIYGEIIDVMYLYFVYYEYEKKMTEQYWKFLRKLVKEIKYHWNRVDSGIWEFRSDKKHYTHSVMMCHVGMDRASRIAQHFGKEKLAVSWRQLADDIKHTLLTHHYNEEAKAFTMYPETTSLDASVLLMASHEVLAPDDARLISTVRAIYKTLRHGALVQRYDKVDDFGKTTSSFTICSFWLVEALWYIGEVEKARKLYEQLLKYSNHVGLYSEDIDIKTKRLLGNFPQGYTHIALINTTIQLSEWNVKRKKIERQVSPRKRVW